MVLKVRKVAGLGTEMLECWPANLQAGEVGLQARCSVLDIY